MKKAAKKMVVGGYNRKKANKPLASAGCSSVGGKSNQPNPGMKGKMKGLSY